MREMNKEIEEKFMELLSFMCSSARGCVEEPKIYGPLRIIDSMRRIIEILKESGVEDEFLEREKKKINERMNLVMYDEKGFIELLDELVIDFARKTKEEK
jgi:hypothetical protein